MTEQNPAFIAPPAAPVPTATDGSKVVPPPASAAPTIETMAAELAMWKENARKNEKEWKAFSKENEELKKGLMTEAEKAIADAKKQGIAEAEATFAQRSAAYEIRVALAGLIDDPQNVVDDLNLAKYVTDNGEVDAKAVAALKERFAGLIGTKRNTSPDLGQGNRGIATPPNGGDLLRDMYDQVKGRQR
jgi:hypothetical protein